VAASRGVEQRGARSVGPVHCSGAVLLRAADNGGRYCTCRSTLLPAGPAWCTAWGLRALHQRGLAVRRRDWQAAARPPTESLTLSRKISMYCKT
jgi:hypothetical protein